MTAELPPQVSQNEEPREKHFKLPVGRDALLVVAGVMISMSAGITPVLSVMLVRESIRYLESKLHHSKEK
jgi:hypothetical protein